MWGVKYVNRIFFEWLLDRHPVIQAWPVLLKQWIYIHIIYTPYKWHHKLVFLGVFLTLLIGAPFHPTYNWWPLGLPDDRHPAIKKPACWSLLKGVLIYPINDPRDIRCIWGWLLRGPHPKGFQHFPYEGGIRHLDVIYRFLRTWRRKSQDGRKWL